VNARGCLAFALALCLLAAAPLAAAEAAPPSFCAEWVRQSREGYERVTLFTDQTLVWKTKPLGSEERVRRKKIEVDETKFYCDFFSRTEYWNLPTDLRTRLNAEFVPESTVTLTRPDGSVKQLRFDDLSALSLEGVSLRSALEGLRTLFTQTIAPPSKFTVETLAPGTVLTRLDGETFRVKMLDAGKGVVELEGLSEPFTFFRKIEELRFLFHPPGQ
jgi:hypothetical protein